jgi:hypothetical protein
MRWRGTQAAEAIAAKSDLFKKCSYDLQGCVEANRLAKERFESISKTKMKSWNLQSFIMSKKNHCPIVV